MFCVEYAQVSCILGNCRVSAYCFDGVERMRHVRGKFRRRVWINRDDIILVGLRDYQDEKADIIHRYSLDEARTLKSLGELPAKGKHKATHHNKHFLTFSVARIDIDVADIPDDVDDIADEGDKVSPQNYLGLDDLLSDSEEFDEEEDEEEDEEDFYEDSVDSELDAL